MELKSSLKSNAGKAREKLNGLIPSRHIAKWKLTAEVSLALIVIVGLFEILHYFFHVYFSEEFLTALELIDYAAIFILAVDLIHHYLITPNKDKFIKNKFIYILSFIPYLIFHKALGALYFLKPVFTGIAKIIKIFFHSDDIKERAEDIKEELTKKKQKN